MITRITASLVSVLLIAGVAFAGPAKTAVPRPVAHSTSRVVVPSVTATTENAASCDISTTPSATLLLPYFEVDIHKPVNEAPNTIFTIVNTTRTAQIARVTIWTDQAYPAFWFNLFMTGFDEQSISLYDVLALGLTPQTASSTSVGPLSDANDSNPNFVALESCSSSGGPLSPSLLTSLQTMLTLGTRDGADCRVGSAHALASGYVTVDVVNSCTNLSPLDMSYYSQVLLYDNVLTGEYERINPDNTTGNYAGGNPLVHIKAIPEGGHAGTGSTTLPYTFYDRYTPPGARRIDRRQPLPATFVARFIQGGTGDFFTDYAIWREGSVPVSATCLTANAGMPITSVVRFDEDENPSTMTSNEPPLFAASGAVSTSTSSFPPMAGFGTSGWMFLNLDNHSGAVANANSPYSSARPSQNWVTIHMRAEGRYAVDYDATTLANGCSTNTPSSVSIQFRPRTEKSQ